MSLLDDAHSLADDLTDLRHRLHREPEIGLHLPLTQEKVLAALDGLGLEISTGTSSTSITAVLRGGANGAQKGSDAAPVVLLRGDMDALPVVEEVDVDYRSTNGAMHACGHDLHTAMLVGAAHLLSARQADLPGDVVFMFQPGEEGYDGAGHMIAEGVLDAAGRRPNAAFALHVMSNQLPAGIATTRGGPMLAASDALTVRVIGRGGHGSAPHLAADPVPAACEMVLALQTAMTRTIDPFAPSVLTVGMIHGGTARNIISDDVVFEATIRSFDPAVSATIRDMAKRVCEGIAAAHGVRVEVTHTVEYPVTVNDHQVAARALEVAGELFGVGRARSMAEPITGAEDFSRVVAQVPGAMLFLGAAAPGCDPVQAPSNHSALAAFDDGVLPDGAALYTALALDVLAPGGVSE